jgi:hypothetical protein
MTTVTGTPSRAQFMAKMPLAGSGTDRIGMQVPAIWRLDLPDNINSQ